MVLQDKINQLDSLERLEMELEIEKRLEKKKDCEFKRAIEFNTEAKGLAADRLIAALDKRYIRRTP